MFDYSRLIGLPYIEGMQDCFSLVRRYYREAWDIRLPNFARPSKFWQDPNLDLYELYVEFGFKLVIDRPYEEGDAVLMPLLAPMNTHAGVIVEPNRLLHHVVGRLSTVDVFVPSWSGRVNAVVRHPLVTEQLRVRRQEIQLHEVGRAPLFRDPEFQAKVARVLGSER